MHVARLCPLTCAFCGREFMQLVVYMHMCLHDLLCHQIPGYLYKEAFMASLIIPHSCSKPPASM